MATFTHNDHPNIPEGYKVFKDTFEGRDYYTISTDHGENLSIISESFTHAVGVIKLRVFEQFERCRPFLPPGYEMDYDGRHFVVYGPGSWRSKKRPAMGNALNEAIKHHQELQP